MGTVKMGLGEFFCLTVLFELGTALVVNLGMGAGRDAWLSILLGCAGGLVMFTGYAYLYRKHPEQPFTAYTRQLLGKYIGTPVAVVYIILYLNLAGRDLRDGSTMLAMSTMHNTPLFILSTLMLLSVAYVLHKGLEVLGRTAIVFAVVVMGIGLFATILLVLSGTINLNRLMPMLENGLQPVIASVIHQNYMFPFGEMVCFTMLMPYLGNVKKGPWIIAAAMLFSALLLSFTMALNVSVLGADIVERSPLPLMPTISKITISDFIQRVDIFVVMVLIIGVFFKMAVFFAAALVGISGLFRLPYRRMVYPCGLIILFTSMLDARSFIEHLEEGSILLYRVYPFVMLVVPALLVVVTAVRDHFSAPRPG